MSHLFVRKGIVEMGRLTKKQFEEYLGKKVKITLFDMDVIAGELHKCGEEIFRDDDNFRYNDGYYFLINPQSVLFISSHVKKVEVIK